MAERRGNSAAPAGCTHEKRNGGPPMLAWRIWRPVWGDPETFGRLLSVFGRFSRAVDEISLFDDHVHVPARPLDEAERDAALLRRRMETVRKAGISSTGINVLVTLGHGMQSGQREMPFAPMVGHDGEVSNCCPCWNRCDFREYVIRYYRRMAETGPDFIWVDDDYRTVAHGVRYPCFCEVCLQKFGHGGDRMNLIEALNDPANRDLRRAWLEFLSGSLVELAGEIRNAIHDVDERIEVGLMTIGYSQSTYAYRVERWAEAFDARRARPGHGYYSDAQPRAVLDKIMDVARQVRDYPRQVSTVQYELENWPYVTLNKSVQTVLNECTLAISVGCNGVAFNAISERAKRFEEYEPLLQSVVAHRPVWRGLREAAEGLPLVGFWPADRSDLMARQRVDEEGWFHQYEAYDIQRPNELAQMSIPLTADPEAACGVLLSGRLPDAFTDEELRGMLEGAVLMDDQALGVLWERGLGELAGVRPGCYVPACYERLTDHSLNGEWAGDGRRIYPSTGATTLEAARDEVLPLSRAVDQVADVDRGICLSACENELGGRVAVGTYVPWNQLGRAGKQHQLIALCDWLCRGRLPVVIEGTVRVAPFVRMAPDGKGVAVVLFNMSLDATGPLTLRLRACRDQVALVTPDGAQTLNVRVGERETFLEVPSIPAWQTAVLLAQSRQPDPDEERQEE